jgi:hypothetical protein
MEPRPVASSYPEAALNPVSPGTLLLPLVAVAMQSDTLLIANESQ